MWPLDSPILFLGGHRIIHTASLGHFFPLIGLQEVFGLYGIVVRKQWLKPLIFRLRNLMAQHSNETFMSPDLTLSRANGLHGTPCFITTPLMVDHRSNAYSDNWKEFR